MQCGIGFDLKTVVMHRVRLKNAIDEVVIRGFYGALPLSYGAAILRRQLRRWDSNPRHPAPEACTPNRQSIVCGNVEKRLTKFVNQNRFDALTN